MPTAVTVFLDRLLHMVVVKVQHIILLQRILEAPHLPVVAAPLTVTHHQAL